MAPFSVVAVLTRKTILCQSESELGELWEVAAAVDGPKQAGTKAGAY